MKSLPPCPFSFWLGWTYTHPYSVFKPYMFLVINLRASDLILHIGVIFFFCLIKWCENSQKCCILLKLKLKKHIGIG